MELDYVSFKVYPYNLISPIGFNARTKQQKKISAIIRFEFKDGSFGLGDCSPFPKLGDNTLDCQIEMLKQKHLTPITKNSLLCAQSTGLNKSLLEISDYNLYLEKLDKIPLHYPIDLHNSELTNLIEQKQDRTLLKVKIGKNMELESYQLKIIFPLLIKKQMRLRLDFNSNLSADEFKKWYGNHHYLLPLIDCIEDPFPYDKNLWSYWIRERQLPLAIDFEINKGFLNDPINLTAIVLKPARQDWLALFLNKKINTIPFIITHYMDHLLGHEYALSVYYRARKMGVKLLSTGLYPHSHSIEMSI